MAMRTDTAQPIRLKDYRPPDWLVETVSLDFSLHPTQAKVRATIKFKPNPLTPAAPLVLDGNGLSLVSLKLNGAEVKPDGYRVTLHAILSPEECLRLSCGAWANMPAELVADFEWFMEEETGKPFKMPEPG